MYVGVSAPRPLYFFATWWTNGLGFATRAVLSLQRHSLSRKTNNGGMVGRSQTKKPRTESPGFRLGATASHQSLPVLGCSSILRCTSHFQKKRADSDLPRTLLHLLKPNDSRERSYPVTITTTSSGRNTHTHARSQEKRQSQSRYEA